MGKFVAELMGTFVLVFGGCGAAVLAGGDIGFLGVSFAFGLALLAMVYVIGPVSGCHVNPAVTVGLLVARKIKPREAGVYIAAQVLGAVLAAGLLFLVVQSLPGTYDAQEAGFAANGFADHSPRRFGLGAALVVEVVLTFLLVLTVLAVTDRKTTTGVAGIVIGLVLTLIHLVGIPVTNMSVNPARSLGPALFVGGWALTQLWVFIVAPLVGAALAALAALALGHPTQDEPDQVRDLSKAVAPPPPPPPARSQKVGARRSTPKPQRRGR